MDGFSPSLTPGSRPPPLRPPTVAVAADTNDDDSEKKAIRQRRLSFGIPETPAATTDDQATQIASLLQTVAELEKTARRTQAESELLIARNAAPTAAAGTTTEAALTELTAKLTEVSLS